MKDFGHLYMRIFVYNPKPLNGGSRLPDCSVEGAMEKHENLLVPGSSGFKGLLLSRTFSGG